MFKGYPKPKAGFELNIFKMGSWNHMGHNENMIKDFIRQMCVPLENSVYFGDGDGFNSDPAKVRPSIKNLDADLFLSIFRM